MKQLSGVDPARPATQSPRKPRLGAVLAAALSGTFVEWFDFALFAYTVPIFATQYFTNADEGVALLYTFAAVYGVSFIFRPLGGLFWGHIGDRIGRKRTLAAVIITMGIATALVGLLPTQAAIGIVAPIALIALRLLQAFCAGGEMAGAQIYVLEQAPPERRGFLLGLVNAMAVVPFAVAALLVLMVTNLAGAGGFADWGWRALFVFGGLLAVVGLIIRRAMPETEEFAELAATGKTARVPIVESFQHHKRAMTAVFFTVGVAALAFYFLTGFLSVYASQKLGLSRTEALVTNVCALFVIAALAPTFGALSDRFRSRRIFILTGIVLLTTTTVPAFALASEGGLAGALVAQLVIALGIAVLWGGGVPLLTEAFPARIRYSGAAVSYNIAYAVLGGTAPLVSQAIANGFASQLAPAVYVAAVALITLAVCVPVVPETAPGARKLRSQA